MKYKRNKDKDFWQMARAYLHDFMPAVRNQSDKSVAAYKQSLNSYLSFLESEKGLKEDLVTFETFNRSNVKDFVEWLHEKKYAPKTINLKLTAIRSFLRYCADEDFELRGIYNDVCTVRKAKEEKKPIEYLQPEATKAILASYDTRTAKHRRNRMILILLYDTGARVQELSDLSLSSLHLDVPHPYVTLIGKGRKTRNVPVMDKTVAHLRKYLEDRVSCPEVPENVHCHLIRKTKAMDLYRNGVPLPFIMQLLGHESMSTTSGFYAFATLEMMSDAMNKAAPAFDDSVKIWKKSAIKKLLYSLD